MSDAFIKIPDDAPNSGKKVHVRSRVIGSDTVHRHVVEVEYPDIILGGYYLYSGQLVILNAAHAADAGFAYLTNPIGSGVIGRLRRIRYIAHPKSTTTRASSPEIRIERFTFSGTPSGATITPAKRRSADAGNQLTWRTASTGVTITPGEVVRGYLVSLVPSGGGNVSSPNEAVWEPLGDEGELELNEGEGLMFRQHDGGEAADDRVVMFNNTWLEVAIP
jgi:hypothetical protein